MPFIPFGSAANARIEPGGRNKTVTGTGSALCDPDTLQVVVTDVYYSHLVDETLGAGGWTVQPAEAFGGGVHVP